MISKTMLIIASFEAAFPDSQFYAGNYSQPIKPSRKGGYTDGASGKSKRSRSNRRKAK